MITAMLAASILQTTTPCTADAYREFDFWVGDWTVTTTDGKLAGQNRITKEEGGCLLVEHWTSAKGGTGQSYNYWDPHNGVWRQLWVSAGSIIDYAGNLTADGTMRMEGIITYHASPGTPLPFRGQWTPNDDGTVTQKRLNSIIPRRSNGTGGSRGSIPPTGWLTVTAAVVEILR